MPDEVLAIEPKTESLEVKARLTGSLDEIYKRLSSLQLFIVEKPQKSIRILRIESRDMQKRPFLFFIIELSADNATINYAIAPDSSPKIRRLYVLKTMISIISLISDIYSIDDSEIFQYLDSAIDDVLNSITQGYSTLFNNYDSLFNEYRELKRLNIELEASNKNLSVQTLQLSDENKSMAERLKALESYSDSSLMVMVEEWLESHDGSIDINEFAKNYKMNPTRVEQILNKMVTMGYIDLKG